MYHSAVNLGDVRLHLKQWTRWLFKLQVGVRASCSGLLLPLADLISSALTAEAVLSSPLSTPALGSCLYTLGARAARSSSSHNSSAKPSIRSHRRVDVFFFIFFL